MVKEWTRQTVRAMGVSVLAPLVLLLAAAGVASGGGLGGLGALGQVAGGPALPDLGTPAPAAATLADADIVGADTSEPTAASGTAAPGTGTLPSAPGGGGGGTPGGATDPVNVSPLPPVRTPGTPGSAPQAPAAPSPGTGTPVAPGPVDDVTENTRELGESLPGPLGPTTGDILDLLLPPRSR
jgi:hypothetical protein